MPQHIDIPCIIYQQRLEPTSQKFAIFSSTASDLQRWATIQRRHQVAEGQQRRLSKAKISAISRFLQQDVRNTIAPAVTVAIRPNAAEILPPAAGVTPPIPGFQTIRLQLPENEEAIYPGVVIDGQHRLLGINGFNPQSTLPVVALLDAPDAEIAFQFVVINNKSTRVASDLIRTLAIDFQEHELSERLKKARVTLNSRLELVGILDTDAESPFAGMIAFETTEGDPTARVVLPAAIESALAVIDDKNIPELQNEDALFTFFISIWQRIKTKWPGLWIPDSKLMNKVCIVAMTAFVVEALVHRYDYDGLDITDAEPVNTETDVILESQREEFWTAEWKIVLKDSKAVRDRIVECLTRIGRNVRSNITWDHDVDLIAR